MDGGRRIRGWCLSVGLSVHSKTLTLAITHGRGHVDPGGLFSFDFSLILHGICPNSTQSYLHGMCSVETDIMVIGRKLHDSLLSISVTQSPAEVGILAKTSLEVKCILRYTINRNLAVTD